MLVRCTEGCSHHNCIHFRPPNLSSPPTPSHTDSAGSRKIAPSTFTRNVTDRHIGAS